MRIVLTLDQKQLKIELISYVIGQKKLSWDQHGEIRRKRTRNTEDTERKSHLYLIGVSEGEEKDNRKE